MQNGFAACEPFFRGYAKLSPDFLSTAPDRKIAALKAGNIVLTSSTSWFIFFLNRNFLLPYQPRQRQ